MYVDTLFHWFQKGIDEDKGRDEEKRGAFSELEHEFLSSMTKGEIIDEIVLDANMGL